MKIGIISYWFNSTKYTGIATCVYHLVHQFSAYDDMYSITHSIDNNWC
jgi:hypothetical protein